MRTLKICAGLVLLLGIAVMIYAWVSLSGTNQVYQEGNAVYDNLSYQIRRAADTDIKSYPPVIDTAHDSAIELSYSIADTPQQVITQIYIPDFEIDYEQLKSINKDAAAWLYSPDTVIDYPVMRANDYSYYLNHLSDGTVNANGSLFIDYNNAADFSGELTVIYGHHMKSGRMFGSLVGYKEQSYYDEHPHMYLYTEQGNYRIDLIYGTVIGAGQWRERAFMYEENTDSLLAFAKSNTTFVSDVEYSEGDRLIALSTCSYEFDNARYVVIGILRPEFSVM